MATITETVELGDGAQGLLTRLLSRFPKGARLRIVVTDDDSFNRDAIANLEDYRARVAAARAAAPKSPWSTTEAALRDLRAAEGD